MLRLLFSLTSRFFFIALLQEGKCLVSICQDNFRQHSEKFFPALQQALAEVGCSLKDIREIYFTDLSGSQTGQRISLAFVLTLQVLNFQVKIYHLSSLLFQVGENKAISLISIDLKKTKYQMAVYQKSKCIVEPQVIERTELVKLQSQFSSYDIYEDFHQIANLELGQKNSDLNQISQPIDFLANFQKLSSCFQLLEPKIV